MRILQMLAFVAAPGLLTARGDPSKRSIIKKASYGSTNAELEDGPGDRTTVGQFGPIEKWTKEASDGDLIFVFTGDSVALQATGGRLTA